MTIKHWQNLGTLGLSALARWPAPEISKVNFALTMRCNHKCVTCSIWQNNKDNNDELTAGDVGAVLQNNPRIMWASLTGGEPTLANDFEEILFHCVNRLPLTNIITNGQLPERIFDAVVYTMRHTPQSHLLIIHVTLFGEEHNHDEMTGIKGSYDKAVKTILRLKEIKQKDRLTIGFEHLISHFNPGEYKFVQYKANQMGVGITYTLEQFNNYYGNNGTGEVHKTAYTIPRISLSLNPIDQFKNTFLLNGIRKAGCVAGEYSCWVMPDKTVYPCFFSIPNEPCFELGTTNYKLRRHYFDGKRKWINQCRGCWTPCESYTMMAFRPWRIFQSQESKAVKL